MNQDYEVIFNSQGIKVLYDRLLLAGHTRKDASNIIAKIMGLGELEKGWSVKELQGLDFYKYIADKEKTSTRP